VVHQLGAGAHGPVFLGIDPQGDRQVAVKAFPLDITPERAKELAATLERLAAAHLGHPSIVAPLGAGSEGSTVYLVQDYVLAESVDVAIRQYGPAPVPDALRLVGQLAGALDFAAVAGVHHGALHSRDVLVAPNEVRLTGLGVAQALESAGVRVAPRRPYSAPERRGNGPWGMPADVFSLAAVAFEMLTGRRPGSAEAMAADTRSIPSPEPDALAEVFARALSGRPEDRFQTALAFAAALRHALTGEPLDRPDIQPVTSVVVPPSSLEEASPGLEERAVPEVEERAVPEAEAPAMAEELDAFPPEPAARLPVEPEEIAPAPHRAEVVTGGPPERLDEPGGGTLDEPPRVEVPVESVETPAEEPLPARAPALPEFPGGEAVPADADDPLSRVAGRAPEGADITDRAEPGERPSFDDFRPVEDIVPEEALPRGPRELGLPLEAETEPEREPEPQAEAPLPVRPAPSRVSSPRLATASPRPPARVADETWRDATRLPPPPQERPPEDLPVRRPAAAAALAATGNGAATSRRSRFPLSSLLAMLLFGVVGGFVGGYFVGRGEPAGPAPAHEVRDATGTTDAAANDAATLSKAPAATAPPVTTPAADQSASAPDASSRPPSSSASSARPEAARSTAPPARSVPERPVPAAAASREPESRFEAPLFVVSRPAGALVRLDGRPLGKTPLRLEAVGAGSHVIRLELNGYLPWTSAIQVVSGNQNRVTASLERRPGGSE
jgi:hypothetical protein